MAVNPFAFNIAEVNIFRKSEYVVFEVSFCGKKGNLPRKLQVVKAELFNRSGQAVHQMEEVQFDKEILYATGSVTALVRFNKNQMIRITNGICLMLEVIDHQAGQVIRVSCEYNSSENIWTSILSESAVKYNEPQFEPSVVSDEKIIEMSLKTSFVDRLSKSLEAEIDFLRKNGEQKYKFINGHKLSQSEDLYLYQVELEAEHTIQESQDVQIEFLNHMIKGEVVSVNDLELCILTGEEICIDKVFKGYLSINSWRLLQAQLDLLQRYAAIDYKDLIRMVMETGKKYASPFDPSQLKRGQNKAIAYAETHPITLIWGPPGTGKTYTIAKMAINFAEQGKSVLLLSHSNVSVDGMTKKILDLLREAKKNRYIKEGNVLRYGYVRDEALAKEKSATSFNFTLHNHSDLQNRKVALEQKRNLIIESSESYKGEHADIEEMLRDTRLKIKAYEAKYVHNASILSTTISKATVDPVLLGRYYDVVMFDEASMAYMSQIYAALTYAKEKFICVGDFRQLSPIVKGKEESLKEDIFQYLGITDQEGKLYNHKWLVMLDQQRRMHPDIADFSSQNVYNGLLKTDTKTAKERSQFAARGPFPDFALGYLNLSGIYAPTYKSNGSTQSRYNPVSAVLSMKLALHAAEETGESVGIICPYAEQVRLLQCLIKAYQKEKKYQKYNISAATVHQFQGSERNTIIFDPVENYPAERLGYMFSRNEDSILRLINVAITRARGKFILVANDDFWQERLANKTNILAEFFEYMRRNAKQMTYESLQIKDSPDNILSLYGLDDTYKTAFSKDIRGAKQAVDVLYPDAKLFVTDQRILGKAARDCTARNIDFHILSECNRPLTKEWDSYVHTTSQIDLPIITIDRDIVWYGIPQSNLCFERRGRAITTKHTVILRISCHTFAKQLAALLDVFDFLK